MSLDINPDHLRSIRAKMDSTFEEKRASALRGAGNGAYALVGAGLTNEALGRPVDGEDLAWVGGGIADGVSGGYRLSKDLASSDSSDGNQSTRQRRRALMNRLQAGQEPSPPGQSRE
jgi:hypothetical protein